MPGVSFEWRLAGEERKRHCFTVQNTRIMVFFNETSFDDFSAWFIVILSCIISWMKAYMILFTYGHCESAQSVSTSHSDLDHMFKTQDILEHSSTPHLIFFLCAFLLRVVFMVKHPEDSYSSRRRKCICEQAEIILHMQLAIRRAIHPSVCVFAQKMWTGLAW